LDYVYLVTIFSHSMTPPCVCVCVMNLIKPFVELFEQYKNCIFVSSLIHAYDVSINNDRNSNLEFYSGEF
jgi:hypothetical protein